MTDIEIPEGFTRWDGKAEFPEGMIYQDKVKIIIRSGKMNHGDAWEFWWPHGIVPSKLDIIAYRIVP